MVEAVHPPETVGCLDPHCMVSVAASIYVGVESANSYL